MKLYIDTDNEIIEIDEEVSLKTLIDELKKLVGRKWSEYKIRNKYQNNTIYIPSIPTQPYINPSEPYPIITYQTSYDSTQTKRYENNKH